VYFFMLLYRKYASKCLWKVWILVKQLFGAKGVTLHAIVQAICLKMPVKSLISCQTILHGIVQVIFSQYSKKLLVAANNLSNILLPEFKIRSNISQTINLHKCIQITDILSLFLLHNKYNAIKKVSKSVEISWKLLVHLLDICQAKKSMYRPIADPPQTTAFNRILPPVKIEWMR
jgi:hypothetical protein